MKMTEAGNALVKIAKVVEKNQPVRVCVCVFYLCVYAYMLSASICECMCVVCAHIHIVYCVNMYVCLFVGHT